MKKNIGVAVAILVILLIIAFFVLKPKAPNDGFVAVLTENDAAVLPLPQLEANARHYVLADDSILTRTGRKVGGYNNGTVDVIKGAFAVDDKGTAAGKFVIDMKTIKILDMSEGTVLYDQLLDHLRNGFFAVDTYPTVEFDLKKATKKSEGVYNIVGDLKLKGVSREISFPAQVEMGDDYMIAKANFFIDRTARGIDEVIQIADKYIQFGVDFTFSKK